jgi:OmpA-OmpF porin, OOP family
MPKPIALALAVCLLSTARQAAAAEESAFYLGGNFGVTRMDSGNAAQDLANTLVASGVATADVRIDESAKGFKALAGYQVNRNFALEGYYANLGKFDLSFLTTGPTITGSGEIKVTGFGVDALGIFPINEQLSGLLRAGLFRWDAKFKVTASDGTVSSSDSGSDDGSDLKLGIGIEWKVGRNIRLRADWEHYTFDDAVNMLSAGIVFRFE